MSGYVYILTNPSFKDDWVKIGKSSRPVDVRSKELDNTAVPLPFKVYATLKTAKYNEAERQIHQLIDLVNPSMRIRKGREFFNVTPETALRIFKNVALTLDDAEIILPKTQTQLPQNSNNSEPHASKSKKLTFAMLQIPIGSELTFTEDPSIKAHTLNNKNLIALANGTQTTLSHAVTLAKRQLGTATTSEAYQGGTYWMYQDKKLIDIRAELGI